MVMAKFSKTKINMGGPNFMEESLISYEIGDLRVPKILGNWGPGVPILGGPYFHVTPITKHLKHGTSEEPKPINRDRGLLPPVYDSLIRTHPPPDTHLCR